eukprot:CAMPEP_0115187994 /NCGR_PEP_ID=MMETSP0270-20121206/10778_2 /TAXON_ID=71861 /ORGANISM="Scrippsiella trochoidea, Strain CCMP3099" /LENGTH=188 /DNA_ID=CAMNT_0002601155 /DNA_START=1540 /DNA_END=2104 /DNA_ORIENTATION=-
MLLALLDVADVTENLALIFFVRAGDVMLDLALDDCQDLGHNLCQRTTTGVAVPTLSPGNPVSGNKLNLLLEGHRVAVRLWQETPQRLSKGVHLQPRRERTSVIDFASNIDSAPNVLPMPPSMPTRPEQTPSTSTPRPGLLETASPERRLMAATPKQHCNLCASMLSSTPFLKKTAGFSNDGVLGHWEW